jgi:hypothetical protein
VELFCHCLGSFCSTAAVALVPAGIRIIRWPFFWDV